MASLQLDTDINQFFAYAALVDAKRYDEARPAFSYRTVDLLLGVFAEAFDLIEPSQGEEYLPALLRYAQVFERFGTLALEGVDSRTSARTAAALYWLAGYSANALVLARWTQRGKSQVRDDAQDGMRLDTLANTLVATLTRGIFSKSAQYTELGCHLRNFMTTGSPTALGAAQEEIFARTEQSYVFGNSEEYVAGQLLRAVLARLSKISLWGSTQGLTSAPVSTWRRYARIQADLNTPLVDLWPSQRRAISKGVLNGQASLVLRMPTSAGKTKLTELTFINDLATHDGRCLYIAPFRALVTDVEASIGPVLSKMGFSIATLYGAADTNDLEVELSQQARVVIATPEKIAAVLRMSGGSLADFETIVIDEGHLVGSPSRGAAFELQLATLRRAVQLRKAAQLEAPRIIFLSAVMPNSEEIAAWLTGGPQSLAESNWQPTAMRIGILTWGKARYARIDYLPFDENAEESAFFVPRLIEEDKWQERYPETGRLRSYKFPDKRKAASVAASLAFQSVRRGSVLVYAQQPRWVHSVVTCMLDAVANGRSLSLPSLDDRSRDSLLELVDFVSRRLGGTSLIARALRQGIAVHHSGVPQGIRLVLEDAFRTQVARIMVATSTVAQGVNFPARTVILHSLPAGEAPVRDLWNLAGRAGRAMCETEGDMLIVETKATHPKNARQFLRRPDQWRLRQLLDKTSIEPVESQILQLVRQILERLPTITVDAVAEAVRQIAIERAPEGLPPLAAVDAELLEQMIEDADGFDEGVVENIAVNLLATHQAAATLDDGSAARGIRDLLTSRAAAIRAAVPTAGKRRRYARSGLAIEAALSMDDSVANLRALLLASPELTSEALLQVLQAACLSPELSNEPPDQMSHIVFAWMRTGDYASLLAVAPERLTTIDEAIEYVETVIGYKLSWTLNGLVRLVEADEAEGATGRVRLLELPEWFRHLPQYVRYGVDTRELLWVMTLGLQDREYASQVLAALQIDKGARPTQFREVAEWVVANEAPLMEFARQTWLPYYAKALRGIATRYGQLLASAAPRG